MTHTVSGYGSVTTADSVTVTVSDDEVASSVSVAFEQSSYTVAEGSMVSVKVTLSADPERTVTIPITTTNQGGATSADYSGVPANLVFNSGDTEKTITFTAASDSVDDDGESVKLAFGTLPTGVSEGTTDETTVSITDDDVPSVSVAFEQSSYTVAEGSMVSVKVTLSADPERTVTIPITTTNQGGATSADYSGVPASLVFNSGDTEKTITFTAVSDSVDDDGESVKLAFGTLPTGVSEGTTDETTVSITDDDVPSVSVAFEQSSYTVAEGSMVSVKVQLSADPERTVTIPIAKTNQGGATSADYSGVPASLVFNSGDTEKTITFNAASDSDDDDEESVKLAFGTLPTGVSEGTTNEATVSITDDDVPSVSVAFEQSSYTVAEGSMVSVKVQLSADPERTVTIPIAKTNQGGATSADYSGVPASLVFNSGDTEKTITFTAASDSVDDDGESVKLAFGTLPTGVSEGTTNEATVSITDDDVPSVSVAFEQSSYTVAEGSMVSVKITLSADPERTVTIPIAKTNQGGATSADYSGVPASLVFNSGDTEKTITFTAASDSDDDDGESVKLAFGTLPTGVSEGTTNEATVSITDDDVPSVSVAFEQSSYTVAEGSMVSVKITLSADPERTVTIPIAKTNQGGASAADYSGVPASLVFNSGDTEKTITFNAASDSDDDDGESVKLAFGTLPTGVSTGTTDETTVSITDVIVGCAATSVTDMSARVNIPDGNLLRVIERALGKPSGAIITYEEIASVEEIRANDSGIASMEGLQYATGLRQLRLDDNDISSAIDFCGLTELEQLHLSRNNIGGDIDLTSNEALLSVWLSFNRIESLALPHAPNLRNVSAFNNRLTSVTTSGRLLNMVNFNLGNNHLTSIDLTDIGGHTIGDESFGAALQVLNLAHNRLTSINIPGSRRYEMLDLSGNRLTSFSLPWLPELKYLYLRSNQISSWPDLHNTGNLIRLDLAYNQLSNAGEATNEDVFISNKSFPELKILWLSGNKLQTLQFNSGQVPKLEALYLENNWQHRSGPAYVNPFKSVNITNAPVLEYLDLRNTDASCPSRSGLTCVNPS